MLDIKFIRENSELIKEAARKKHIVFDVVKLIEADDLRLKILREAEDMRAKQNAASDNIAKIQNPEERQKAIGEMKELKEKLLTKVEELRKANDAWRELMHLVPNIPDVSVPEGESDAQNAEVKKWGRCFVLGNLAVWDGIFYEERGIFADDSSVFGPPRTNDGDGLSASRRRRPLPDAG